MEKGEREREKIFTTFIAPVTVIGFICGPLIYRKRNNSLLASENVYIN